MDHYDLRLGCDVRRASRKSAQHLVGRIRFFFRGLSMISDNSPEGHLRGSL